MFLLTTILAVRRGKQTAMAGDGQVTLGEIAMKHKAKKIRTLYDDKVMAGFAGAVADALTLFEKFEAQLEQYRGNLRKAAVELGKEWRTDKFLRRLEAQLIIADAGNLLVLSGDGDIVEPDDDVVAIGSGGPFAQAAAGALLQYTDMSAEEITRAAMLIAARMCIFTNDQITMHVVSGETEAQAVTAELPLPDSGSPKDSAADDDDDDDDENDEVDEADGEH